MCLEGKNKLWQDLRLQSRFFLRMYDKVWARKGDLYAAYLLFDLNSMRKFVYFHSIGNKIYLLNQHCAQRSTLVDT